MHSLALGVVEEFQARKPVNHASGLHTHTVKGKADAHNTARLPIRGEFFYQK